MDERGPVVVIVDDNIDNLTLANNILGKAGYSIRPIRYPLDVVEAVNANFDGGMPIDLFLIDYNMPDMNGFELSRVIYQETPCRGAPVIISSSFSMEQILRVEGGLKPENVKDHIRKPHTQDELKQIVEKTIRKYPANRLFA